MVFDIFRTISHIRSTVYRFRIFPIVFTISAIALTGCQDPEHGQSDSERLIAINVQLDAVTDDVESFVSEVLVLAGSHGGVASFQSGGESIELRVPVEQWEDVFTKLRDRPEAAGGEQVWGQDITDQVNEITMDLASATGEEAARLQARLDFRLDRVARAVIVIRVRGPG